MAEIVETSVGRLSIWGGELCLDFVNTVGWRLRPNPIEYLHSIFDLIDWSAQMGTVMTQEAAALQKTAVSSPKRAAAMLSKAIQLREVLFRIFSAVSGGTAPAATDLDKFNELLLPLMAHAGLVPGNGDTQETDAALGWDWLGPGDALDRLLWPIAWSAAGLLVSGADRVRLCEGEGCGWLFVDTSKNGRRQWCSMKCCGNRAKARRHYEKLRQG